MTELRPLTAPSFVDDPAALLPRTGPVPPGGLRLPDGRTFAWAEFGNSRGWPCLLIPDRQSSRLAPGWLLHGEPVPHGVRLLAVDRPGIGASDPVGAGTTDEPADDLRRMIETLAVGRVAVIGIGAGADVAMRLAVRYPTLVTCVVAVAGRVPAARPPRGRVHLPRFAPGFASAFASVFAPRLGQRQEPRAQGLDRGLTARWTAAATPGADLRDRATWSLLTERLSTSERIALGDRWEHAAFRDAVAADVAQCAALADGRTRAGAPTSSWVNLADEVRVPVHCWHGTTEPGADVAALRDLAHARDGWTLTEVPGTAQLDVWPEILADAARSFSLVAA